MYKNVKLIDKVEDKNIKVKPIEDFAFAKENAQCIVGLNEFYKACINFPVFFTKNEGKFSAMALLGLQNDENLFIDKSGKFLENTYIPMAIRRYPFIYVQENEKLHLAYDTNTKALNKKSGQQLFTQDGKNTEYLESVLAFLNSFQQSLGKIETYIVQLNEAGVLIQEDIVLANGKYKLNGFYKVDENKLTNLDEKMIKKLVDTGAYKIAVVSLVSYFNLEKLVALKG